MSLPTQTCDPLNAQYVTLPSRDGTSLDTGSSRCLLILASDLMKKHFIAHDANEKPLNSDSAETARALATKVRTSTACASCARTKTKCDNQQPCSRCSSKGLECLPRTPRPRGPRPKHKRLAMEAAASTAAGNTSPKRLFEIDDAAPMVERATKKAKLNQHGTSHASRCGRSPESLAISESLEVLDASNMLPKLLPMPSPVPGMEEPASIEGSIFVQQLLTPEHFQSDAEKPAAAGPQCISLSHEEHLCGNEQAASDSASWQKLLDSSWDIDRIPSLLGCSFDATQWSYPTIEDCTRPDSSELLQSLDYMSPQETHVSPMDVFPPPSSKFDSVSSASSKCGPMLTPKSLETSSATEDDFVFDSIEEDWVQGSQKTKRVIPTSIKDCLKRMDYSQRSSCDVAVDFNDEDLSTSRDHQHSIAAHDRDRMIATTQHHFKRAMKSYGLWTPASFMTLPSCTKMEHFISLYASRIEPHYHFVGGKTIDTERLLAVDSNHYGMLVMLSIIAAGAMLDPDHEAQYFSVGISEMCRITFKDLIKKDEDYATSDVALKTSRLLRFTQAWSGISDAGALSTSLSSPTTPACLVSEQEMGLFGVCPTQRLDIDLEDVKLDDADGLPPTSLQSLIRLFLNDELDGSILTTRRLRLLLYPLQTLVDDHRRSLQTVGRPSQTANARSEHLNASAQLRQGELQFLLKRWQKISDGMSSFEADDNLAATQSKLMFHIISLSLFASWKDAEVLAGRMSEGEVVDAVAEAKLLLSEPWEAIHHSGRMIAIMKEVPATNRPVWWAAALYRAALIIWAYSLALAEHTSDEGSAAGKPSNTKGAMSAEAAEEVVDECIEILSSDQDCNWFELGIKSKLEMLRAR
ncbi:hypothetical protein BDZ85DRAFT_279640 [Elsinoe ampelina]|uniref:Zn(2)-C6 fungal-type domain-containing protein n=1 Tax=Elsinoe ampelina TaxID=302913 RepID=A0A6A6GKV4_9PEZI|nr:hypothetical protein BDZ85DRAFT_279640 [Elsinoe ampelina]